MTSKCHIHYHGIKRHITSLSKFLNTLYTQLVFYISLASKLDALYGYPESKLFYVCSSRNYLYVLYQGIVLISSSLHRITATIKDSTYLFNIG